MRRSAVPALVALLLALACRATASLIASNDELASVVVGAKAATEETNVAADSSRVSLTQWSITPSAPNGMDMKDFPKAVTVPCTLIACLMGVGYYDFDPFYGKNLQRIPKSHFAVPWSYTSSVSFASSWSDELSKGGRVLLQLEGINYRIDVRVNGELIADQSTTYGGLNRFAFDITSAVQKAASGAASSINVTVWRQLDDPGRWRNNQTDLSLWFDDWNPHPPDLSTGLYQPVYLKLLKAPASTSGFRPELVTFDGFAAHTKLVVMNEESDGATQSSAFLNISVAVLYWGPIKAGETLTTSVSLDLSKLISGSQPFPTTVQFVGRADGQPATARAVWSWVDFAELNLVEPPLWWPWQFGYSRPMFTATVTVGPSTSPGASGSFKFALRDVQKRLTAGGALQFVVNGRALAIMAGGYPPDMFLRWNATRMALDFDMMVAMGLNAVRLEGMLQDDPFFDMADERGFLVMPGLACCDGWQHWSRWPKDNYRIAADSLRGQARRLEGHPSVITFLLSSDELPPGDVEIMYNNVFADEAWPNTLVSSASQQFSNVSGISGVKMVGPYSWVPPNYWLEDGRGTLSNGTSMNYGGAWGFFTEGGPGESPMTYASWVRTVPPEHLWNETDGSLDSWWSWHMGCPYGHFRNLTFYTPPLDARYGKSNNAQTYLYRSQAANFEGIRAMFESYSRNRHLNATGVVQWQVKMAWPSHVWNLYDYYFVTGGGFYGARRALERLHAMMSYDDGSVWLIGNRYDIPTVRPINVQVTVYSAGSSANTLFETSTVVNSGLPADGTVALPELQIPTPTQLRSTAGAGASVIFVRLQWWEEGLDGSRQSNWYWVSTQPDIIGPWTGSNSFRTPCYQWADFTQLNALPSGITKFTQAYSTAEDGSITGFVNVTNTGSAIAFLVQVRFVDRSAPSPQVAPDIAPVVCDDNFFSIAPGDKVQVTCKLPAGVSPAADVQTYNDVVSGK